MNNTEAKKAYFTETAIVLRCAGFDVERTADDHLSVKLDGQPLCEVKEVAGIVYRQENLISDELVAAKDRVYEIACMTKEYMRQLEHAPPLNICGLGDRYRILADFNGTVLAAMNTKSGVQFATWDWDFDRSGVSHGHYFTHDYEGVKQDFVTRSGLIPQHSLFSGEQLIEMYRCCADALNYGLDLSPEQEKIIKSIQDQIESGMPDIMDQIREQEQNAMTAGCQEPSFG